MNAIDVTCYDLLLLWQLLTKKPTSSLISGQLIGHFDIEYVCFQFFMF